MAAPQFDPKELAKAIVADAEALARVGSLLGIEQAVFTSDALKSVAVDVPLVTSIVGQEHESRLLEHLKSRKQSDPVVPPDMTIAEAARAVSHWLRAHPEEQQRHAEKTNARWKR